MFSVYDGYNKIDTESKHVFFAGANTSSGFSGLYQDIADESSLERVYIIKGAAGTGKSTIMKRIAEACEAEGYTAEYFLCGSDPSSVDCVIIDGRIAVLDGTYPHVKEMQYPGCSSSIIDLSKFWNTVTLGKNKDEIMYLSACKSAAYASAYRYIRAAEQLEEERRCSAYEMFDRKKAEDFIDRFIKNRKISRSNSPGSRIKYTHAFTMRGRWYIDLSEANGYEFYSVRDTLGFGPVFMELLTDKLRNAGVSFTVYYMPLNRNITAVSLDEYGISAVVEGSGKDCKNINLKRFEIHDKKEKYSGQLKLAGKCEKECIDEIDGALGRAAEYHFRLEEIYGHSMDFDNLGIYSASLCDEILLRLKKHI